MPSNFKLVQRWHRAFGVPVTDVPGDILPERQELRKRLMREELEELEEAMASHDLVHIADGIADLLYVVYGTAAEYGIPIDEVFIEVQRSNMTKLGADGKPIYREDGKVAKGPNFELPNLGPILKRKGQ